MLGIFAVKQAAAAKQHQRDILVDELNTGPVTDHDQQILNLSVEQAVKKVKSSELDPTDLLNAYGKRIYEAHKLCNPVTEILSKRAYGEWAPQIKAIVQSGNPEKAGPLAGFPVSLKDTICVEGYDSCIGYTRYTNKPAQKDAVLLKILLAAGAIPFVKTNVPLTLLSFESYNDIWGTTSNPYSPKHVPGGSTGGEAALLAVGGSRIGVGTDVAGSVRVPAHFSGIYSLKCSTGRFPRTGNTTSMPGQEGIPAVYSPMARTLPDLTYFLKSIVDTKPWTMDYSVHPLEWRQKPIDELNNKKKLRVGVMFTDGIVDPSPACARALQLSVDALRKKGHEIIEIIPENAPDAAASFNANKTTTKHNATESAIIPSTLNCLRIASQLLCSDAVKIALRPKLWAEYNDKGVERFKMVQRLPRWMKRIWAWYLENIVGDHVWATLVRDWNEKKITERWDLVYEREGYKAEFFEAWNRAEIDFMLTVPNATPALKHRGLYDSASSCGYSFMFNLLDYAAGVLPVTRVDASTDAFTPPKKLNRVAKGAYANYDAGEMAGLPVGVQVVCGRLEEEKCLAAMAIVESALHDSGVVYRHMNEVD